MLEYLAFSFCIGLMVLGAWLAVELRCPSQSKHRGLFQ